MKNKMEVKVLRVNNLAELFQAIIADMTDVEVVASPSSTDDVKDFEYYIAKIAERKGWKFERTNKWLKEIEQEYPAAAFNIVLKEIAIDLDKKYPDHISESEHIYVISTANGRIVEADKTKIRNYKNFAAFRTIDDAKFACKVLRQSLKDMGFIRE